MVRPCASSVVVPVGTVAVWALGVDAEEFADTDDVLDADSRGDDDAVTIGTVAVVEWEGSGGRDAVRVGDRDAEVERERSVASGE